MTDFTFNPKLPDWIAPVNTVNGRPSVTRLNEVANTARQKTLTVAAEGAMCPILYGEVNVGGLLFALGFNGPNLVVGYIWGIGEVESIDYLYINDEDVPAGVSVTHYTGTPTQGVDPTLAAAIPAYLDTLRVTAGGQTRGLAYSVIEVPPNTVEGFPRVRATIKGRKVYDPRTDSVAFSDTPSLCMADLINDSFYGLGVEALGVVECADWNDELLGGLIPRARISLVLSTGRPIPEYLDILSEYSECWYTFEGEGVRMTPDRIVDLTQTPIVDQSTILKGSLSMSTTQITNAPTEIEVRFTSPTGTSEPWKTDTVVRSLPDVDTGQVARIPTTVALEGVYREVEASNRALSKLNRLKSQTQVSWISTDVGILRQIGDVVRVNNPNRGFSEIPVRIEKANLTSAGRYAISGTVYSPEHYPSEIDPSLDGVVPEGAIGLLAGDVLPSGWSDFSSADGRAIKIASDQEPIGSIGGSPTLTTPAITTTANPAHGGEVNGYYIDYTAGGSEIASRLGASDLSKSVHDHEILPTMVSPNIYRRINRLVIKTNGGSVKIPKEVMTLGLDNILDGSASRVTQYEGRALYAGPNNGNQGLQNQTVQIPTEVSDDRHSHRKLEGPFSNMQSQIDFKNLYNYPKVGGGNHSHTVLAAVTDMLKRYPLALYSGISDYSVKAGRMFLWAGDTNNLPENYVLVEEAKGYFIELSGAISGPPKGDNTLILSGDSDFVTHNHATSSGVVNKVVTAFKHTEDVPHNHSIDETLPYEPPYFCLALIMYQPQD